MFLTGVVPYFRRQTAPLGLQGEGDGDGLLPFQCQRGRSSLVVVLEEDFPAFPSGSRQEFLLVFERLEGEEVEAHNVGQAQVLGGRYEIAEVYGALRPKADFDNLVTLGVAAEGSGQHAGSHLLLTLQKPQATALLDGARHGPGMGVWLVFRLEKE